MISRKQSGAALIVGLILLAVATIVTLLSMSSGQMQERMTANTNTNAIAFQSAEAGASTFWEWIRTDPEWGSDDWQVDIPVVANNPVNFGVHGYYWVDPNEVRWDRPDDGDVTVTVRGQARAGQNAVAHNTLRVIFSQGDPADVDPAFRRGLLSDEDIDVSGASVFEGSVHANGDFINRSGGSALRDRVDGEGNTITSTISASGDATFGGGDATSGAAEVDVPSASEWIEANKNRSDVRSCSELRKKLNDGETDLGGRTYYCEGGETFTAQDMTNGTVMVDGDARFNGSSSLGSSNEITFALVASGDIRFNGQNDTFGSYWADGTVEQNGASLLVGSVIAGRTISRNGAFNYRQVDEFGDVDLPKGNPQGTKIASWGEVLR